MKLLSAGVLSVACVVTALACGDSDADPSASSTPDGGVSPSPDASVDGATADGPVLLKAGLVAPLGVTAAGMLVYGAYPSGKIDGPADLEAMPITGGAPVKILTNLGAAGLGARMVVAGGAVAWWTNVTDGIGTLNVWNATDGVKTALSTTSAAPTVDRAFFYASADGRRVAFSTNAAKNADAMTTNFRVVDVASATNVTTGMLPDDDVVVLDDPNNCPGDMRFAGKNFIASFCRTGAERMPRAYVVRDGSTTAVRFDDKGEVGGLGPIRRSIWRADDTGNKVFVPGEDPLHSRFLDLTNPSAIVGVQLSGADEGFVSKDGTAVIYLTKTTGDVTRWATADGAKKRLARGVTELSYPTNDGARALIVQNKINPIYRTFELNTEAVTKTIASAFPLGLALGFTGSGSHVMYMRVVGTPPHFDGLSSIPSGGGPELELATGLSGANQVYLPPEGDGVVVAGDITPFPAGGLYPSASFPYTFELRYIDVATGASVSLGDATLGFLYFSGKKVVFLRVKEPGAGIYVFEPK
jgi:hypothetical protein